MDFGTEGVDPAASYVDYMKIVVPWTVYVNRSKLLDTK